VDPTGQFWRCHAAVVGRNADKARAYVLEQINTAINITESQEEDGEKQKQQTKQSIEGYLDELSAEEALKLACQSIEHACSSSGRGQRVPFVASSSTDPSTSEDTKELTPLGPRLMALALYKKHGHEVKNDIRWYSQTDLLTIYGGGGDRSAGATSSSSDEAFNEDG
jgi:hypothetical protein